MTAPIEGVRDHVAPCFCDRCADQRTAETLRLLALDAASVDAAWSGTLDAIRAEGRDLAAAFGACDATIVEATGEWAADFARHVAELKAREPEIIRAMIGDALGAEAPSSSLALASLHDDVRRRYAFPLTTPEPRR